VTLAEWQTKADARATTIRALERGTLERKPCEVCGATPAETHHDDYSQRRLEEAGLITSEPTKPRTNMNTQHKKIRLEESAPASNGSSPLHINGASEGRRKLLRKQSEIRIEHPRASVRRTHDGGLIVTRHIRSLTFLSAKAPTWKRMAECKF
jgi:hypothetical protein